jgi:7-cyano-7-deazaguanine synthase
MSRDSALVLFSGGQDSTTTLAWALNRFNQVETVGFNYGQRHSVEMDCRSRILSIIRSNYSNWATKLSEDHVLDLSILGQVSETALTRESTIKYEESGLPNTFVPGRNLMFFTLAAAIAYRRGQTVLVGGMCETDFSGYPDCRDNTIKALQVSLSLGLDSPMTLETPLMWLTKSQTWQLAKEEGGPSLVDLIVEETHTCYLGNRSNRHVWGYGCGSCPACELRRKGFEEFIKHQP